MNPLIQLKTATPLFFIVLLLACFALPQRAQAVSPPPDGGYPGANTAEGQNALLSLTSGSYNTAVGLSSLRSNATGKFNTAVGAGTLLANTADQNTAIGFGALLHNTTGLQNAADGTLALFNNTIGHGNTANGVQALFSNTTGSENTAIGIQALFSNTLGNDNTAIGIQALFSNITGGLNTAIGGSALGANTTGNANTVLGDSAGSNVTTASNVICIGQGVVGANVSNSCYIGQIFGQPVAPNTGTAVFVDNDGKLGTILSSRRFKHDIKLMDKSSEAILALKPVTFHYKSDAKNTPQFGLIAEEVAKVNADLVVRDKDGEIYTVRYDAVNAMLLNEFLKEHRKVEEQEKTITQLKQDFQATTVHQQEQIETLTVGLQKVADQFAAASPSRGGLETSKATSCVVVNNP